VPRLRDRRWRHERTVDATIDLMIGPAECPITPRGAPGAVRWQGLTDEQLAVAWLVEREVLMSHPRLPGTRPWGFWRFELGEEMPSRADAQAVRLAELGLLTADEFAGLYERATEARMRVGTDRERISGGNRESGVSLDAAAVELWEAVQHAGAG